MNAANGFIAKSKVGGLGPGFISRRGFTGR
jgi:hypothetical protein